MNIVKYNDTYNAEIRYFATDYIKIHGITDDVATMYIVDENKKDRFFYRQNWAGGAVIELVAETLDDGTVYNVRQKLLDDAEKAEIRLRLLDRKAFVLETGNYDKLLKWICTGDEYNEAIEKMRAIRGAC